uniref:Uncharacterized protein n=1 Tax=Opuntia streptacantha TaxID=393608 RepID=A0A7C8YMS0_OPUST
MLNELRFTLSLSITTTKLQRLVSTSNKSYDTTSKPLPKQKRVQKSPPNSLGWLHGKFKHSVRASPIKGHTHTPQYTCICTCMHAHAHRDTHIYTSSPPPLLGMRCAEDTVITSHLNYRTRLASHVLQQYYLVG